MIEDGDMCVCVDGGADVRAGGGCLEALTPPSTAEGEGDRDTGRGGFSMCRGETGETEGETGSVCPGDRKMGLR